MNCSLKMGHGKVPQRLMFILILYINDHIILAKLPIIDETNNS